MAIKAEKHEFEATVGLSLSNSFATLKTENNVKLQCTLGIKDQFNGWFEIYDIETGGESWYAEGCIEFHRQYVVGYDGCFDLPSPIKEKLVELGYSLEEL
ncbi:MAG: hypothetical protein ACW98D_17905 [Promethearchaeota archaeon]|jgi:hypothetical protein